MVMACQPTNRAVLSVTALLCGLPWGVEGVAVSYAAFGLLVHGVSLWGAARRGPVAMGDIVPACAPLLAAAALSALLVHELARQMQAHGIPVAAELLLCGIASCCDAVAPCAAADRFTRPWVATRCLPSPAIC